MTFQHSGYFCYLCNQEIPRQDLFDKDKIIILPSGQLAHRECQINAEVEARMEQ